MAKVKLGHPIVQAHGRFAGARFRRGSTILTSAPPRKPPRKTRDACPCKCWLYADALWQRGLLDTQAYRAALKRPGMSAYDLWMHEAVALTAQGHYYPDAPSISGGWGTKKASPGTTWHPYPSCIPDYAVSCVLAVFKDLWGLHHVTIDVTVCDTRTPHIGIREQYLYLYIEGIRGGPYRSGWTTDARVTYHFYLRSPYVWHCEVEAVTNDMTISNTWFNVDGKAAPHAASVWQTEGYSRRGWWANTWTPGEWLHYATKVERGGSLRPPKL